MPDLGRRAYGLAAIAVGLVGLWWRDFASVWQPVPQDLPARAAFACFASGLLLVGGIGLQSRRTARAASLALAGVYSAFVLLWLGKLVAAPHVFSISLGLAEELALAVAAVTIFGTITDSRTATRLVVASRIMFGICFIVFGVAHFAYLPQTAAMVPAWLPPAAEFWAVVTGAAHLAAGLALVSGFRAVLAARLATVMFAGFGVLVWLPRLAQNPADHMTWAGNSINFALVGAIWLMGDMISRFGAERSWAGVPLVRSSAT